MVGHLGRLGRITMGRNHGATVFVIGRRSRRIPRSQRGEEEEKEEKDEGEEEKEE